jgi:hypothetical protein
MLFLDPECVQILFDQLIIFQGLFDEMLEKEKANKNIVIKYI